MLKACFFIFAAFLIVLAVSDPPTTEYPDKPGYCRIKNVYIKEGETGSSPIGECHRIKCKSATPGKSATIRVGCGTFQPAPGCHRSPYDYTKPYPACCPKHVCGDKQK